MENGIAKVVIVLLVGFFIFRSCRHSNDNYEYNNYGVQTQSSTNWTKSPVDELIKKHSDDSTFSIILYDMDADESSSIYKHKYRVIIEQPDTVLAEITDWYDVSAAFFNQHINDMGMTIASKTNGEVTKQTAPAGYNNYIGNPRYGHWRTHNGSSFWEFYGKYAFMRSMFDLMTYPARRTYWDEYRGGYYRTGRSYYGPSGNYGTKSYTSSSSTGKTTTWASKPSSFKDKVRSSVSRSTSTGTSRSYSSGSSYSNSSSNNKTTRNTMRTSTSSSFRSRSGGFGK